MEEDEKLLFIFGVVCYVALLPLFLFFSVAMFNNLYTLPIIVAGFGAWLWVVLFVAERIIIHYL